MTREASPGTVRAFALIGVVLMSAYAATAAWAADGAPYDVWIALVVLPGLLLLNVALVLRAGRRDPDPRFLKLLVWAFALKCLASVGRYLMVVVLYDGGDSLSFDREGARLSAEYRNGNFEAEIGREFIGTGFMRVATAVIYVLTGPSLYVAWAVFSMLSFWGVYFLYRAFRVAVPLGNARRYAVLLLLPSMLFWPSGIGKEALVVFGIGLAAYGSGLLLSGYRTWAIPLVSGLVVTAVVRPHITAALFAALVAAWFLRRRTRPADELTPLTYVGGLAAILAAGALVASFAATFLGVDPSVSGVDDAISDTTELTDEGGSAFTPATVHSPLDLPFAGFTVLFRPMLVEATNPQMLIAAAEGTLLLVLVALSWRSLLTLPGRLRRQPYLIFALVYAVIFVYAFSNFGNFGIITRQRVQVLPFFLVFLALRPPLRSPEPTTSMPRPEQERALT